MNALNAIQMIGVAVALPLAALAAQEGKLWTGTLTARNPQAKTITLSDSLRSKTFHLGANCVVITMDERAAGLNDLRPGEQLVVHSQRANGSWVVDWISQKALQCAGSVQSIDAQQRVATVTESSALGLAGIARQFRLASNCKVTLPSGQFGSLENVQPGDKVTIFYKSPNGVSVAYRIESRSRSTAVSLMSSNNR